MTPPGSREPWPQSLKIMVDILIQLPTARSERHAKAWLPRKSFLRLIMARCNWEHALLTVWNVDTLAEIARPGFQDILSDPPRAKLDSCLHGE